MRRPRNISVSRLNQRIFPILPIKQSSFNNSVLTPLTTLPIIPEDPNLHPRSLSRPQWCPNPWNEIRSLRPNCRSLNFAGRASNFQLIRNLFPILFIALKAPRDAGSTLPDADGVFFVVLEADPRNLHHL